jgi:serine/threonine protein kinase
VSCHEKGEFLLVYEFIQNGSLDSHLFGKRTPLSWSVRHKIALGLVSCLLYLHEEWERCVVHRDIKSSNVMLDSSFNVKLGDFGLGPRTRAANNWASRNIRLSCSRICEYSLWSAHPDVNLRPSIIKQVIQFKCLILRLAFQIFHL